MSTAPPGWHLQPDGRERYWDGQRWTDEFRMPSTGSTQEIPLDDTRGMPVSDRGEYASRPSTAVPPPGHGEAYPREPYYEGPGGPLSDQPGGTPGWLKGCLGVLIALVLIAVIGVVAGVWWLNRNVSDAVDPQPQATDSATAPTATDTETAVPPVLPTGLPTALPTGIPTELPTGLPSLPGQGEAVDVSPGDGFTLGPVEIQPGWTVDDVSLGFKSVTMQAIPTDTGSVPLVFTLAFLEGGNELASTVCTVSLAEVDQATDVACLPMRTDVSSADTARASGMGG